MCWYALQCAGEGGIVASTYMTDWSCLPTRSRCGQSTSYEKYLYQACAARAFYDCPAIISHRPRSQNISKEAQLNPEKDSRIKTPRSQVSLEKASQNYKPLEK